MSPPISIASSGGHARRRNGGLRARCVATATAVARRTSNVWMPVVLGVAATSAYGPGHLGYDVGWSLLWGQQIAAGQLPSFEAPGAPTPHPLANAVAALLSPLGDHAGDALVVLSALCFGLLGWAAYLLGARLFSRLVGALFAAIVLTRPAFVNSQGQALIDIPFVAFVLMAGALEAGRRRRPSTATTIDAAARQTGVLEPPTRATTRGVLAFLILAGLLRPEGWLFMGAYVLYLLPASPRVRDRLRLLAVAAIAPCAWAAFDLLVTGDPLHSLHGTQQLAAELDRPRSFGAALSSAPWSLANVLGAPLTLLGLAGCLAAVLLLYRRALLPLAAIGLGLISFMGLGIAGLPVLTRYLVVPVVMLGLFAAVALLGWRCLARDDWRRVPWIAAAAAAGCLLATSIVSDVRRDRATVSFLAQRRAIEHDLHALAGAAAWRRVDARPVHVTTRRALPLLAAWLGVAPDSLSADQPPAGASVLLIGHATRRVATNYYSLTTPAWSPAADRSVSWHELYRNDSWLLLESEPALHPGSSSGRLSGAVQSAPDGHGRRRD